VNPPLATLVCLLGIFGMFWLDRDPKMRPSPALWIPFTWILLACSRPLTTWFHLGPTETGALTAQLSEGSPVDRAVLTAILLFGLMVVVKRGKLVTRCLRDSWPILLFFAYCLLSLTWSDYPDVAFKRWNKAVGDWLMILIVWTDPHPLAALKRMLARTGYVLIPASILFVKFYPDLGRNYDWLGQTHYTGVTSEKNTLGSICLIFGLAALWRALNVFSEYRQLGQRGRHIAVQLVILAMVVWLFSIADAITSVCCFGLASCILILSRIRVFARNPFLIHGLMLAMLLVPVSIALLGFSPDTLQQLGRNTTLTDRTDIWTMVVRLTPHRWVGAGFESFWIGPRLDAMVSQVTKWWVPNQSHNGYLEVYANLGWIGIGCLALVIAWGYGRVVRACEQRIPTSSLMLAYFLAGLVFNISEAAFFRMMIPIWLFFLLAVSAPQDAIRHRLGKAVGEEPPVRPPEPRLLTWESGVQ
jgi:exopolysaccharide production protein ExoQ